MRRVETLSIIEPIFVQSSTDNIGISKKDVNKAFAEVTGPKVNRRAGYGLEISCIYLMFGPISYVERMKAICENWHATGYIQ